MLAFALGVAAAECIRLRWREAKRIHWRQLVLLTEIALLFVVGFFPAAWDISANALVSFSCAMQVQAFRKVHGYPFASTMCIGNLRSGMDSLSWFWAYPRQKLLWEESALFRRDFRVCTGCRHRHTVRRQFGEKTIWLSCALLLVSLCFMFIKEDLPESKKSWKNKQAPSDFTSDGAYFYLRPILFRHHSPCRSAAPP